MRKVGTHSVLAKAMKHKIPVAQFGLGPIGQSSVRLLADRSDFQVVGAVDNQPDFQGRSVAEICQLSELDLGMVYPTFEALWENYQPQAVIHTAGSRAALSFEQCRPMLERGLAVVSSCEELLFPQHRAPRETEAIQQLCQTSGGRIVGTGVNPGFVLDVLPVCLSMVARSIRGVTGRRVVNASLRRGPLQKKIGSGLTPDAFRALWNEGKAGHAGFQESLLLIAHSFGWKMENLQETLEPVVSDREIQTEFFHILPGQTRGLHQIVSARSATGHSITLDLTMALDESEPHDFVSLDSDPPLQIMLPGGVSGDVATVAALVNTLPRLLKASPGVKLLTDLALA